MRRNYLKYLHIYWYFLQNLKNINLIIYSSERQTLCETQLSTYEMNSFCVCNSNSIFVNARKGRTRTNKAVMIYYLLLQIANADFSISGRFRRPCSGKWTLNTMRQGPHRRKNRESIYRLPISVVFYSTLRMFKIKCQDKYHRTTGVRRQ